MSFEMMRERERERERERAVGKGEGEGAFGPSRRERALASCVTFRRQYSEGGSEQVRDKRWHKPEHLLDAREREFTKHSFTRQTVYGTSPNKWPANIREQISFRSLSSFLEKFSQTNTYTET